MVDDSRWTYGKVSDTLDFHKQVMSGELPCSRSKVRTM